MKKIKAGEKVEWMITSVDTEPIIVTSNSHFHLTLNLDISGAILSTEGGREAFAEMAHTRLSLLLDRVRYE